MDLELQGKVALVMGGSRGIGRGIAVTLSDEGVRVAVASRTAGSGSDEALPGDIREFTADTSELEGLARLPAEVEAELGPLDILVTNTGGPPPGGALGNSPQQWELAYRTLVRAPVVLAEAALPGMRERRWGRIVNVGSSSTREPIDGLSLSNTHRAALVGFFKTLSREVAGDGITVNTVATGRIATDRLAKLYGSAEDAHAAASAEVPAGRLGTPDEYGSLVAFLCSDRAAYVTGTVIPIDGGLGRSV